MRPIYVEKRRDEFGTRDSKGHYVGDSYNPRVLRDPRVQREEAVYNFLKNVQDKVSLLEQGESDPKKKAKLIEIATNNLDMYFKYSGKTDGSIELKDEKTNKTSLVTVAELQERLKPYLKH